MDLKLNEEVHRYLNGSFPGVDGISAIDTHIAAYKADTCQYSNYHIIPSRSWNTCICDIHRVFNVP